MSFKIHVFLEKRLVNTYCQVLLCEKWRFQQIICQNVSETTHFFTVYKYNRLIYKAYLTSMTFSTTTSGPGAPPRQQSATKQFWSHPRWSLALSKCRLGASNYGQGMTQSLPLSYWSPEKSYMTSSHTAMLIYISTRFRVKRDFTASQGRLF